MVRSAMFLILRHLNKYGFGTEPATAQCGWKVTVTFSIGISRGRTVSARTGFSQCFVQIEM
jgi:hypothetical protein